MAMKNTRAIQVRCDENFYVDVETLCSKNGESMSNLVRRLLAAEIRSAGGPWSNIPDPRTAPVGGWWSEDELAAARSIDEEGRYRFTAPQVAAALGRKESQVIRARAMTLEQAATEAEKAERYAEVMV